MIMEQHHHAFLMVVTILTTACSSVEDKIRLVDGSGPYEGRVELFHDGRWGTLCTRYAPERYSEICLQLGYVAGRSIVTSSKVFGPGTGWKWTDVTLCGGEKSNPCIASAVGEDDVTGSCAHEFDIGVICDTSTRNPPPVRLAKYKPTKPAHLGVIEIEEMGNIPEVQFGGKWRAICIKRPYGSEEYKLMSTICRQLGYSGGPYGSFPIHQLDNQTFWFDYAKCDEESARIDQCYFTVGLMDQYTLQWCQEGSHILECEGRQATPPAPVRLMGGKDPSEGRVEIYQNGTWGSVCVGDDQEWGQAEAARVCRQLGYHNYIKDYEQKKHIDKGISQPTSADLFDGRSDKIWLDFVKCDPWQAEIPGLVFSYTPAFALKDCERSDWGGSGVCDHDNDVGVVCGVTYTDPPPIRLTGGKGPHTGRLEVYFQDEWGTICFEEGWDYQYLPETVCKQLGFNSTDGLTRQFGSGEGRIWLQNITCEEDDIRIDTCRHTRWGKQATCDHSMDIGIRCDASRIASPSAVIVGLLVVSILSQFYGKYVS